MITFVRFYLSLRDDVMDVIADDHMCFYLCPFPIEAGDEPRKFLMSYFLKFIDQRFSEPSD